MTIDEDYRGQFSVDVSREKERKGGRVATGWDARSIGNRDASVQSGCALETELEDAPIRRDVAVVDVVVDGLWLDLILTLRVCASSPFRRASAEKRERERETERE